MPKRTSVRVILSVVAAATIILAAWRTATAVPDEQMSRDAIVGVGVLAVASVLTALWGGRWLTVAAVVLGLAGYTNPSFVSDLLPGGPHRAGELARCPGARLDTSMSGQIDQEVGPTGALVYRGADTDVRSELRYRAGCSLDFERYCVGQPVRDLRAHAPNSVWYVVGDHKLVPAASVTPIVRPMGARPSRCAGSVPGPRAPILAKPRSGTLSGSVRLIAVAPYAQIVGFAGFYEDVPGDVRSRSWHRIGTDRSVNGGFHVRWDTLSAQPADPRGRMSVVIAAVPCLALDFPAPVETVRRYNIAAPRYQAPGHVEAASDVRLDRRQRVLARREACRNPHA